MKSAIDVTTAVALNTGVPLKDVSAITHSLMKSGAWYEIEHPLAYLLLAIAAEATPKTATSVARHYYHLPDDDGNLVGDLIESMIEVFVRKERRPLSVYAYWSRIEVFTSVPAVRIHTKCQEGDFEKLYCRDGWDDSGTHRYSILAGSTLFDIVAYLSLGTAVA
ncbi:hypothetical protein [Tardiphaga sp. 839_C3_N1_4]|uniref:hypothetical protein n=1 Tax=Tardiphaga sp. 839_C3_N1_4 TaxID=3240761 RepID=UPI003F2732F9